MASPCLPDGPLCRREEPDALPPRLLRAYRASDYAAGGVTVRVGRRCAGMDDLLGGMHARTGVFITAWNPRSRRMPDGWNHRQQHRLRERLRGRVCLPASGSLRRWEEAHLLVAGDPRPMLRLARLFRQRAVVVVARGRPAWLVATVMG